MQEKFNEIKDLIADSKTESALELLTTFDFGSEQTSNAIKTISASYSDLKNKENLNLISFEEASIQKSKINHSLLEIISSNEGSPQNSDNKKKNPKKRLIQKNHIDILINHQKTSLRYYLFYSFGLIVVGAIVIIIGAFFSNEAMKMAMNIGGGLISTLSGFPINELRQSKGKIKTFEMLAIQLNVVNEDNIDEEDTRRLNDLVWKIIEKTALTV